MLSPILGLIIALLVPSKALGSDGIKLPQHLVAQHSTADELAKLKDLRDSGVLTQEEFDRKKQQLLA